MVNQSLSVENARLRDQVSRLKAPVQRQTKARFEDPLASDATEKVKQIFAENAKLRGQLRTANSQNIVQEGHGESVP